ncbi:hypothetical protein NKR23_g2131 [Pleurostoma richardsiae]|uniref:Uncharacterized protein n=1 Tax=Pleurostoma richardsiae TaxID=41990 RepID=A0AA38VJB6_9PEZI|nr:hypothetical protein NKR23_g2131 [Pleurostoma richardsiae]
MEVRDFPIATVYGLRFCRLCVLGDERIRAIVESLFRESGICYLGMYLRYGYHEGYDSHAYRFQMGNKEADLSVLMVQLWAKGSRAIYYESSHLLELPTTSMQNALYGTADSDLQEAGCRGLETPFEDGGVAFFDARSLFKIKHKSALTFAFTTKAVLENKAFSWTKMVLSRTPGMVEEVNAMERISTKIKKGQIVNLRKGQISNPRKSQNREERSNWRQLVVSRLEIVAQSSRFGSVGNGSCFRRARRQRSYLFRASAEH